MVVVGAGLAGLACAHRLHQAGVEAAIYEARADRVGGPVLDRPRVRPRPGWRAWRGVHRLRPREDARPRSRARVAARGSSRLGEAALGRLLAAISRRRAARLGSRLSRLRDHEAPAAGRRPAHPLRRRLLRGNRTQVRPSDRQAVAGRRGPRRGRVAARRGDARVPGRGVRPRRRAPQRHQRLLSARGRPSGHRRIRRALSRPRWQRPGAARARRPPAGGIAPPRCPSGGPVAAPRRLVRPALRRDPVGRGRRSGGARDAVHDPARGGPRARRAQPPKAGVHPGARHGHECEAADAVSPPIFPRSPLERGAGHRPAVPRHLGQLADSARGERRC